MSVAILISSCPKYLPLARWTAQRIGRLWEAHPPVFFSGAAVAESAADLTLRSDERDWMAVTLDAVVDLRGAGFSQVYLVLDDHPPLERCNAEFLNALLPEVAGRLEAAYVGLLGYGQHRAGEGEVLGAGDLRLERVAPSYRWRFSLHPGLWSLAALEELLRIRMGQYPASGHTPWSFERHRDEPGALPVAFERGCYRVNGAAFDAVPGRLVRGLRQRVLHGIFDAALFGVRLARGREVREQMSARWLWAYSYYRGPYPLFWSGVMMQGRENPHLRRFLQQGGWKELGRDLGKVTGVFS